MSFEAFDQKLVTFIKSGTANTFSALKMVMHEDAKQHVTIEGEEFRVIDRRLQALRKKNVINCAQLGRHVVWKLTDQ